LLLPSMALATAIFVWTTVLVIVDELSTSPIVALILRIKIELIFSSIVLPVVCKDTLISLMIVLIVRTPDCLEMKHVEI